MLDDREIRIIKYLYNNRDKFCTSKEIGYNVALSEKTIRNSINDISKKLPKESFNIISKKGSGFKIIINDHSKYIDYMYKSESKFNKINQIYDKEGREKYILENILLENKTITFEDVLNSLFISESTLKRDIYRLKNKLKEYNLDLNKDFRSILKISGTELDKRHFILDFFFSNVYSNSFVMEIEELSLFNQNTISQLLIILLDEIREYKISVNDYIIQNLVIHFALLIERVNKDFVIDNYFYDEDLFNFKDDKIYDLTKSIAHRISKSFNITLPTEEKKYIYLQLLSKTKPIFCENKKSFNNEKKVINLLSYLSKKLNINLLEDSLFINNFMEHIRSLENRVDTGLYVTNPLKNKIIDKYKDYFDLVVKSFDKFAIFKDKALTNDEWAYIVIYLLSAIERNKCNKKIKVLIVCASGFSTGLMLKSRIDNEYNNIITIKGVLGYYEISSKNFDDVDLIISTIDLDGLFIAIPFVKVSAFLDSNDLKIIDEKIKELKKSDSISNFIEDEEDKDLNNIKINENKELFDKYFSNNYFYINMEKTEKNKALDYIYNALSKDMDEREKFKNETILRETFGDIVFNEIIAIPHPVKPIKDEGKIFVYISKEDIYWDFNHKKVRIIFYISPPDKYDEEFEKIIKIFPKILKDDIFIQKLVRVNDLQEFKNNILKKID